MLGTGSLALGTGVWAMHFIGMLAFDLCTDVDYDPSPPSSRCCRASALLRRAVLIARERLGGWGLLAGGVLVGAGIGAMHYAGMAGMRMGLELRYDHLMFGLSIVVAVVLATLALWVRFGLSQPVAPPERRAPPSAGSRRDGLRHRRHALHRHGGRAFRRAATLTHGAIRTAPSWRWRSP
jgi:NO-binding membrane sensor protein with MHYT domain